MSVKLMDEDYEHILKYYKKPIPKNKQILEQEAKKIMAEKLCRCIKKVDPVEEQRSIGICTKTIFNRKGYKRQSFSCKKNRFVDFVHKSSFHKTKKNINNKTRKMRK